MSVGTRLECGGGAGVWGRGGSVGVRLECKVGVGAGLECGGGAGVFTGQARPPAVMEPRPVVLLGALETDMQRYLVEFGSTEDIRFTTCRRGELWTQPVVMVVHVIHSAVPPAELGSPSPRDQALVVESVGEGEHTLQSTVEDIRRVASAGFHCVLSLKPADLLRPAVASLAPIALLLDVRREKGLAKIM